MTDLTKLTFESVAETERIANMSDEQAAEIIANYLIWSAKNHPDKTKSQLIYEIALAKAVYKLLGEEPYD